jgi:hypothetical protein
VTLVRVLLQYKVSYADVRAQQSTAQQLTDVVTKTISSHNWRTNAQGLLIAFFDVSPSTRCKVVVLQCLVNSNYDSRFERIKF